jgi:hypothetical protein
MRSILFTAYKSREGKTSSCSRATARVGAPVVLLSGSIQRKIRATFVTIGDRRGVVRLISISGSTTWVVRFGPKTRDSEFHHRRNITGILLNIC